MATWPVGLPQHPFLEGYRESPPNVALRTEMDAGPAKMRRRFTTGPRPIEATVRLTAKSQVATLDAFYLTTLTGGTLPFDWQDRTGATKSFRFIEPPVYEPIAPEVWDARLRLEILP